MNDCKETPLMLDAFSTAKVLLGDKGYYVDWFCNALVNLKDWRRIHTDYDRCTHMFTPAI